MFARRPLYEMSVNQHLGSGVYRVGAYTPTTQSSTQTLSGTDVLDSTLTRSDKQDAASDAYSDDAPMEFAVLVHQLHQLLPVACGATFAENGRI